MKMQRTEVEEERSEVLSVEVREDVVKVRESVQS